MSRRRLVTAAAAAILLTGVVAGTGAGLLTVLPFLLLLGALGCGRYPGEAVLTRIRGYLPRRSRRAPAVRPPTRVVRSCGPRGSALIAWGIAVRPPPGRRLSFGC